MPFHPCGQFVETLIPRELEFRCHVTVADNPSQFFVLPRAFVSHDSQTP